MHMFPSFLFETQFSLLFTQLHNTHIVGQGDRAKKPIGRDLGWEKKQPEPEGGATAQDKKNRLFQGPLGDPNGNFHCLALASKCHIFCGS